MSSCAILHQKYMNPSVSTGSECYCGNAATSLGSITSLSNMGGSMVYNKSHKTFRLSHPMATHDQRDDAIMISFGTDGSTFVVPRDHTLAKYLEQILPSSTEHTTEVIFQQPDMRKPATTNQARECKSSANKKCQVQNCAKISVSRGLCRGHGGGRRCHFAACPKGAQSRSNFCWAHGGGQRCEVKSCMRSRKSKRFCAEHLDYEQTCQVLPRKPKSYRARYRASMSPQASFGSQEGIQSSTHSQNNSFPSLPSLHQALLRQYRSMNSN